MKNVLVALYSLGNDEIVSRSLRVYANENAYYRDIINMFNRFDDGLMESMTYALIEEGLEEYTSDPDEMVEGFMGLNQERREALILRCLEENKNRDISLHTTEVIV